jgi:hypothetical protein
MVSPAAGVRRLAKRRVTRTAESSKVRDETRTVISEIMRMRENGSREHAPPSRGKGSLRLFAEHVPELRPARRTAAA